MTARVRPKPLESRYRKGQAVKRAAGDIPSAVRRLVMRRDEYRCQRCGQQVLHTTRSIHHRDPRSQGGLHSPANLILLCGSGSTGCHGHVGQQEREEAYAHGFSVRRGCDPASHPVLRYLDRWEQPTADGWVPAAAPGAGGVMRLMTTRAPVPGVCARCDRPYPAGTVAAADPAGGYALLAACCLPPAAGYRRSGTARPVRAVA